MKEIHNTAGVIRFHVGSIRNYGAVLNLERFLHLLRRPFGLGFDT